MEGILFTMIALLAAVASPAAQAPAPPSPYQDGKAFVCANPIDTHVLASLRKHRIEPAALCSDEVFIRRVHLDVCGMLPSAQAVRQFLLDDSPTKRSDLIDRLLASPQFADYWSLKWCDLLRVKAEFPINLWPNAVQAYHRWVRDALAGNTPYDQFARQLLTSSGSNVRVGPVNFYRAVQGREPSALASASALTFMGVRFERLQPQHRSGMESLFSRVMYKPTSEWKEEIVQLNPALSDAFDALMPDGRSVHVGAGQDPREVFADWLIARGNPWFARNAANRTWAWLMGRGIIDEVDDIRPDNPPSNPQLLGYLESELVRSKYDPRHLYRLILNSRTYQQSCIPSSADATDASLFASYPVRRLDAEVLIDALCRITGTTESYTSPIPEPFTYIPERNQTIELADGSTTSQFLEMFGRPARDTGRFDERDNQPTDEQRLALLNSTHIQNKIRTSDRLRQMVRQSRGDRDELVRTLFLEVLSRNPTSQELAAAKEYVRSSGLDDRGAAGDLVWALINTKEFLYRH